MIQNYPSKKTSKDSDGLIRVKKKSSQLQGQGMIYHEMTWGAIFRNTHVDIYIYTEWSMETYNDCFSI